MTVVSISSQCLPIDYQCINPACVAPDPHTYSGDVQASNLSNNTIIYLSILHYTLYGARYSARTWRVVAVFTQVFIQEYINSQDFLKF